MSCEKRCELKFVKITLKDLPIPTSSVARRINPPPKPGEFSIEWMYDYTLGHYPFKDASVNDAIDKERDAEIKRQQGPFVVQGCPDKNCRCFANEPAPDDKAWITNTDPPPLIVTVIVPGNPDHRYQVVWQTERKFAYVTGGCDDAAHGDVPQHHTEGKAE